MTYESKTLLEFLDAREVEIKSAINELKIELKQLKAARLAATSDVEQTTKQATRKGTAGQPTIKDYAIAALNDGEKEAIVILQYIKKVFGKDFQRTSLSPQLSRLNKQGIIERNEKFWSLTKCTRKKIATGELIPIRYIPGITGPNEISASEAFKNVPLPKIPAEARSITNMGAARADSGIPSHAVSGSNPDASTPNSEGGPTPEEWAEIEKKSLTPPSPPEYDLDDDIPF